jgi:hypothetical protein
VNAIFPVLCWACGVAEILLQVVARTGTDWLDTVLRQVQGYAQKSGCCYISWGAVPVRAFGTKWGRLGSQSVV